MSYLIDLGATTGSGQFVKGVAAEALGDRALVHVNLDGTWSPTDAATALTMPAIGVTMEPIPAGMYGQILIKGAIGLASWTWSVGERVYASELVAGEMTQTAPADPAELVQELGFATDATHIYFSPRLVTVVGGGLFAQHEHLDVAAFKIPAAGAPTVVTQDNIAMLSFAQNNSESAYMRWVIPTDYASGDLTLIVIWTNDGGVDDNGKNVRWEINYRDVTGAGGSIVGSNANSPKTVNDTYTSATGHLIHFGDPAVIAAADFAGDHGIGMRITALAAAPTQMTGDALLLGVGIMYTAYTVVPS